MNDQSVASTMSPSAAAASDHSGALSPEDVLRIQDAAMDDALAEVAARVASGEPLPPGFVQLDDGSVRYLGDPRLLDAENFAYLLSHLVRPSLDVMDEAAVEAYAQNPIEAWEGLLSTDPGTVTALRDACATAINQAPPGSEVAQRAALVRHLVGSDPSILDYLRKNLTTRASFAAAPARATALENGPPDGFEAPLPTEDPNDHFGLPLTEVIEEAPPPLGERAPGLDTAAGPASSRSAAAAEPPKPAILGRGIDDALIAARAAKGEALPAGCVLMRDGSVQFVADPSNQTPERLAFIAENMVDPPEGVAELEPSLDAEARQDPQWAPAFRGAMEMVLGKTAPRSEAFDVASRRLAHLRHLVATRPDGADIVARALDRTPQEDARLRRMQDDAVHAGRMNGANSGARLAGAPAGDAGADGPRPNPAAGAPPGAVRTPVDTKSGGGAVAPVGPSSLASTMYGMSYGASQAISMLLKGAVQPWREVSAGRQAELAIKRMRSVSNDLREFGLEASPARREAILGSLQTKASPLKASVQAAGAALSVLPEGESRRRLILRLQTEAQTLQEAARSMGPLTPDERTRFGEFVARLGETIGELVRDLLMKIAMRAPRAAAPDQNASAPARQEGPMSAPSLAI